MHCTDIALDRAVAGHRQCGITDVMPAAFCASHAQRRSALRMAGGAGRSRPTRRHSIRLHVAIIPALRLKPAPDPLYIISGGPGQAASELYLSMAPALARIRRDRDVVIVDQRGTGRSQRLDCVFPEDETLLMDSDS